MVCFYLLMVLLGVNFWFVVVGVIVFGFVINNLVFYEVGYEIKLRIIFYLLLVVSGMLLVFCKRYLLGGIFFGLGLGLDLVVNYV